MIYDNYKLNEIHDMTWPNWGKGCLPKLRKDDIDSKKIKLV
jgi:hypothetical protein